MGAEQPRGEWLIAIVVVAALVAVAVWGLALWHGAPSTMDHMPL